MKPSVMCYVQHLMGTGHQWRAATISRAMCEQGMDVTYVSGGFPVPGLDIGPARFVQLPPARSADTRYKTLVNERGLLVDNSWKAKRRSLLLDTFSRCKPDVILIETFPFGRRLLRFELLPLLDAAHARHPRPYIVASVRDILEKRPKPDRNEQIVELVHHYFDLVLVHSDPDFVPFHASFPLAERIAEKLCYTGYVVRRRGDAGLKATGTGVVVSAGGGVVGEHLLRAAMKARPLSTLARVPWRMLAGHNLPSALFARLKAEATEGITIERNRADFTTLLGHCKVSISQAGYNTMMEVLDAGVRAVVVPYSDEHESEQAVRARLFAKRGIIQVIENHELTAPRLARAVDAATVRPVQRRRLIDTSGAITTARTIASAAADRSTRAAG